MTWEEALRDPRRPLSLSPRDWMLSVEAELEEESSLTEGSIQRIQGEDSKSNLPTSWEKIDLGIDELIQACKIIDEGIRETSQKDLLPPERKKLEAMKQILERGVLPYSWKLSSLSEE